MNARPSWLMSTTAVGSMGSAAVVISADGRHVGVGFRDASGKAWRAHLYFHCELSKDEIPRTNSWVRPVIDEERLALVAAMCERLIERNDSWAIRFGFRFDKTRFDHATGELVLGEDELGLTCATFVLAVFKSVGIDLLKYDEWPARDGDRARFEELRLAVHERSPNDSDHLDALASEQDSVRFRPEEVAAASAQPLPPPCAFNVAEADGAALIAHLSGRSAPVQSAPPPAKQPAKRSRAKTK